MLQPFRAKKLQLDNEAHKVEAKANSEFRKITDKISKVNKAAVGAKSGNEMQRTRFEASAAALMAATEADVTESGRRLSVVAS